MTAATRTSTVPPITGLTIASGSGDRRPPPMPNGAGGGSGGNGGDRADGRKMKENLGSLPAGMVMTPTATPAMRMMIMGNRDDVTAPEMMVEAAAAAVVVVLGTVRKKVIK